MSVTEFARLGRQASSRRCGVITERDRQMEICKREMRGCEWVVRSGDHFGPLFEVTVECYAATQGGAYRIAEAEHPGVSFVSAAPGRIYSRGVAA